MNINVLCVFCETRRNITDGRHLRLSLHLQHFSTKQVLFNILTADSSIMGYGTVSDGGG
jgi:hypothetical protein